MIQVFCLVVTFTSAINLVLSEEPTMFRKNSNSTKELEAIKVAKIRLDNEIQTAINNHPGIKLLESIQQDFISNFHPVLRDLELLFDGYKTCTFLVDLTYEDYLQKVTEREDKAQLDQFQKMINKWEGKFLVNYMIQSNIMFARKKMDELLDEKGILHSIINEAIAYGNVDKNGAAWISAKNQAHEFSYNMLKHTPKKPCLVVLNEFKTDLKKFD
ncbi:uncharacterized protein LOC116337066 [Contarinia nasturtii]|uniref:uncharacterized protein LOC116337066 n=1 Tax=Contarinia nasturtii TaxID=265458 RepID=UPI0012D3D484|nr:uncharacterized protein LOC116337066 [Contarinia nasturtii]